MEYLSLKACFRQIDRQNGSQNKYLALKVKH